MALNEDLTVYFDTDDFAVAGTIAGATVNGIMSRGFVESGGVETIKPVFICEWDDVSGVARGAAATISSSSYLVQGIERDGSIARLVLEAQ